MEIVKYLAGNFTNHLLKGGPRHMGKSKKHICGRKGEYFSEQIRGINLEQVLVVAIDAAKHHQKESYLVYYKRSA